MPIVRVKVTGEVRRAAATVEGFPVGLFMRDDGSLSGAEDVDIEGGHLNVTMNVVGQAGTEFTVAVATNDKTVEKKERLSTDVALRAYNIPLSDFSLA